MIGSSVNSPICGVNGLFYLKVQCKITAAVFLTLRWYLSASKNNDAASGSDLSTIMRDPNVSAVEHPPTMRKRSLPSVQEQDQADTVDSKHYKTFRFRNSGSDIFTASGKRTKLDRVVSTVLQKYSRRGCLTCEGIGDAITTERTDDGSCHDRKRTCSLEAQYATANRPQE
jgi:hypothetical protein